MRSLTPIVAGVLAAATLAGPVVLFHKLSTERPYQVVDGDSLKVQRWTGTVERIRLFGIDAPERGRACAREFDKGATTYWSAYNCGTDATNYLKHLIERNGAVRCQALKQDVYGRTIATCWAGQVELGAAMVKAGWAVAEQTGVYDFEETIAKQSKLGIWQGTFQRPSQYRKAQR